MSDDLADFFEENTHWVDSKGNTTSVKPPQPPKSRREMRRRRNVRRRKTIIVLTMVVAVLVVVIAGGFFGVRALRAIRDRNDGDTYSVQDYSGQGYGPWSSPSRRARARPASPSVSSRPKWSSPRTRSPVSHRV